jgi:phosphoserine phosphatase
MPALVVFDLDGTLIYDTSASVLLGRAAGYEREMMELERAFQAGHITNRESTERCAAWFAGLEVGRALSAIYEGPWIAGIPETIAELRAAGSQMLLATLTWTFVARSVGERYGFAATCGTEMTTRDGVLTGDVIRYFDSIDKAAFVREWCRDSGIAMADVVAIGDARSDIPLFEMAGFSIALNATADARAAAAVTMDTHDLRDVLTLINGF